MSMSAQTRAEPSLYRGQRVSLIEKVIYALSCEKTGRSFPGRCEKKGISDRENSI